MNNFPIFTNLIDMYTPDLEKIEFNNSYDMRINGVQTALSILGYFDDEYTEINATVFGVFDINTMMAIKAFQIDEGLPKTGRLDEKTYKAIFKRLKDIKNLIIIKTGPDIISIENFKDLIDQILNDLEYLNYDINTNDEFKDLIDNLEDLEDLDFADKIPGIYDDIFNQVDYKPGNGGLTILDSFIDFITDGRETSEILDYLELYGGETFDEMLYNYIVSGGSTNSGFEYNYNSDSTDSFQSGDYNDPNDGKKNYNYIYSLLANSIYSGNLNTNAMRESLSMKVLSYDGKFDSSDNSPLFHEKNSDAIKKRKFNLTIIYGADGSNAKKLISVTPISVSQQTNASGEPIFDVYEFVAKDVVDGNAKK